MSNTNLIYKAIAGVMSEDLYIKRGSAGQGTGVLYDEVIAVLKPLLVKHGIVVMVDFLVDGSRANAKGNYIYEGYFDVHYICVEDGSRHTSKIVAHSMDAGDKAPGKAITYAAKISHVKVFGFETGVNDESRAEASNTDFITERQYAELYSLMVVNNSYTEKASKIMKAFNINSLETIKRSKFDEIKAKL
jgi:hypothetical protein